MILQVIPLGGLSGKALYSRFTDTEVETMNSFYRKRKFLTNEMLEDLMRIMPHYPERRFKQWFQKHRCRHDPEGGIL